MEGRSDSSFLILWDADFAVDWIRRTDTYLRLRDRANSATPAITAQAYAEIVRVLRIRPSTTIKIDQTIAEIKEHLIILDLTADHAEAYAEVVDLCKKNPDLAVADEPWFAWQVALNRGEGHRIMTKAPQRYCGLVDPADLA